MDIIFNKSDGYLPGLNMNELWENYANFFFFNKIKPISKAKTYKKIKMSKNHTLKTLYRIYIINLCY